MVNIDMVNIDIEISERLQMKLCNENILKNVELHNWFTQLH